MAESAVVLLLAPEVLVLGESLVLAEDAPEVLVLGEPLVLAEDASLVVLDDAPEDWLAAPLANARMPPTSYRARRSNKSAP